MSSIAVINAGASSIKFAIFHPTESPLLVLKGQIEGIGTTPRAKLFNAEANLLVEKSFQGPGVDHAAATQAMMRLGSQVYGGRDISVVGHRVVHGGADYSEPLLLTDEIIEKLTAFIPLAPLYQPHNLATIRTIRGSHPHLPQVACFDTAFLRAQSAVAQSFAIPRKYWQAGIRRYGFHGISYEFVMGRLKSLAPELANGCVIVAHPAMARAFAR
jgi:acetate kinase